KHRIYDGLQLTDLETGKPIRSFTKKNGRFGACAVSADGRLLAQCVDEQFIIWDMTTGRELQTIDWKPADKNTSGPPEIVFAPNGKSLAAGGVWYTANQQHHPWFAVWELASGKERWRLDNSQLPNFMPTHSTLIVFSPDCKSVLLTGDRGFHLWDLAKNKE